MNLLPKFNKQMTFDEFKAVIKDKDNVIYYWNLWQDSRAYGCKNTSAKPVFEDFLNTIDDPDRESLFQRWARESVEDEVEESSPAPDGPDYKKGDLVVVNGRHYVLDEYDDGMWWALDNDGGEIEFQPGTEDHHEPMSETKPILTLKDWCVQVDP